MLLPAILAGRINHLPAANALNLTCADSPAILSYHIHAIFDEKNNTAVDEALALRNRFVQYVDSSMEMCAFSHSNAAVFQDKICFFPFDNAHAELPHRSPVFNAADYAFFIPKAHNLAANEWWRRNRGPSIHYINHANTGCQDKDHTAFAQFDFNYGRSVNTTAFYCCHDGPPGCTCDNVQYALQGYTDKCLSLDGNNSLTLSSCTGSSSNLGSWRETLYVSQQGPSRFRQLENYGNLHYGNTYRCLTLASSNCEAGAEVVVGDCRYTEKMRSQFGWSMLAKNTGAGVGEIVADGCPGLCLNIRFDMRTEENPRFELVLCGSTSTNSSTSSRWARQQLED
jgi:hypothetical protein